VWSGWPQSITSPCYPEQAVHLGGLTSREDASPCNPLDDCFTPNGGPIEVAIPVYGLAETAYFLPLGLYHSDLYFTRQFTLKSSETTILSVK